MRTIRTRKRTATLGAAVTAVLALALTACGGDDGSGTKSAGPASSAEATTTSKDGGQASDSSATTDSSKSGGDSAKSSGSGSGTSNGGATKTGTSSGGSGGGDTSDSYAYKHPCPSANLTVRVYPRDGAPTQQVIQVTNNAPTSCGLSYYPRVSLGAQNATDHSGDIIPLVPGGLGGAPAYPVKPGASAIAVLDFNPGGGNGVTWVDEMSVLPDGDNMSNAEQVGYPLPPDAKVGTAKLGLYRSSIADAVSSMESANTKP